MQNNGGPTFTHALLSGSTAIEGGHSSGSNTDQRGLARPVDSPAIANASGGDGSDIGAYEVQADQLPGCNTINRVVNNNNDSGTDSLRAVMANVCAGSTIIFAPNVRGSINLTSGELSINKSLDINGPGANLLSVQRSTAGGIPDFRIFDLTVAGRRVSISGLTIANGKLSGFDSGGGIQISSDSTVNVTNCTIAGNTALSGGGVVMYSNSTVNITNSTISGNSASAGGGILTNNSGAGIINITNSTIAGNSTTSGGGGGGIRIGSGTVNIASSTISGNSADSGGGIYINRGGAGYP